MRDNSRGVGNPLSWEFSIGNPGRLLPEGFGGRDFMFNMRVIEPPTLIRQLFCSAVYELWLRGFDTQQIAKTLHDDQAHVERALHEALDLARRKNRNERD